MTTSRSEGSEPHVSNKESHTEPCPPPNENTTSAEPLYYSVGEPLNKEFMKRVPAGSLDAARRAMMLEK